MSIPFRIEDCMRRNPATISAEASLSDAIQLIQDEKLTGVTVTNEKGCVVGVLSELDCLQGVLSSVYNEGSEGHLRVVDVMCTEVTSCAPDDDIVEVAQSLLKARHRRRPVIKVRQ